MQYALAITALITGVGVVVLSLDGLRGVIAKLGFVPRTNGWFSRLIYRTYEEFVVETVLRQLDAAGHTQWAHIDRGIPILTSPLHTLVCLIKRNLFYFDETLMFGHTQEHQIHFYIDTMEASLYDDSLQDMTALLLGLLRTDLEKGEASVPDFVLVPKVGNPILGRHFAHKRKALSIIAKSVPDPAYVRADDPKAEFIINFEGAEELMRRAKVSENTGKRLSGICVDCNVSGGSGMRDVMTRFNAVTAKIGLPIEPVSRAYVLFRAVDKEGFDEAWTEAGFVITRYLDFSEEAKDRLKNIDLTNPHSKKGKKSLQQYIAFLLDKGLIKVSGI